MGINSKVRTSHVILVFLILIIIIYGYICIASNRTPRSSRTVNYANQTQAQPGVAQSWIKSETGSELLKYATVKTQEISYANSPRMVHRVVFDVTNIPPEAQIKTTALHIWENGNKHWTEFTVFMYLPDINTNGEAFAVAEFRPHGLKELRVQMLALSGTEWEMLAKQKEKLMSETASRKRKEIEKEIGPVSLTTEMKKNIYRASSV